MDIPNHFGYFEDDVSTPYVVRNQIGRGQAQCTVRKARKKTSPSDDPKSWSYAQKSIEFDHDMESSTMNEVRQAFKAEIRILRQAKHHYVVEFIDTFEVGKNHVERPQLSFVMRLANGNIEDFVLGHRKSASDIQSMSHWFICLAGVVDYIHGIGIRHRDIKPQNILLGDEKNVLLADFGISSMGLVETLSTTLPQWAREPVLTVHQKWNKAAVGAGRQTSSH